MSVTNEGAGIPGDQLPLSGLGLYIAKGIIAAHGGEIWAESTPGCTTTFHIRLPLASDRGAS